MSAKKRAPAAQFLNVDLDIYSRYDLQPLVNAFGNKVINLYVGRERKAYSAHLELAAGLRQRSADSTIRGFCKLIQTLPETERELWKHAKSREFSVGVQAGRQPFACDFRIEAQTVRAVAELRALIVLTVYGPERAKRTIASR